MGVFFYNLRDHRRMTFGKFVQIGAVVYINSGKYKGKLATIVNIVDQARVLVDGPCTGVPRDVISMKSIQLTKFTTDAKLGAKTSTVKKCWEKAGITDKWNASSWAISLEQKKKRQNLNCFDRFKLMKLKQARRVIISREVARLNKANKSA